MEFTEYSVFHLNWTDKKGEAKNTRLFRNIKDSISYCRKPHYRPYDGFERHLDG